jgi:CheY-like chemotaxis protein
MLEASEILNASILIVDDQEANVMLLEKMLRNAGYKCITSTTQPRTVCASHLAHRYDLILLDLQMPDMDGFQIMEGLKEIETTGYLPVLVITAQPGHKLRALQAGAKDFVSKPFDLIEVQTRIHNMLEVRLLYRKLDNYNKVLEQTVQERTAELRESEARFKSLTELSSDWYWEQDPQGKFTKVSGPVFEMLGRCAGRDEYGVGGALECGRAGAAEREHCKSTTLPRLCLQPQQCQWQHAISAGKRGADVRFGESFYWLSWCRHGHHRPHASGSGANALSQRHRCDRYGRVLA